MTPHQLVHLVTGGLTRSPEGSRASQLLAMMDRPCEALVEGRQCRNGGKWRRGSRWVCGLHCTWSGARYVL